MTIFQGNEEPLRYESNVVEDAGLLLSPLDNLLYELQYKRTTFGNKREVVMQNDEIIDIIKASKIPKEDVLAAIMSRPELKEDYNEHSLVFEYLKPL